MKSSAFPKSCQKFLATMAREPLAAKVACSKISRGSSKPRFQDLVKHLGTIFKLSCIYIYACMHIVGD